MLWDVWRVVTASSAIYMGSQIGVFAEILVTHPGQKRRHAGEEYTGFPGCIATGGGIERTGYVYVLPHEGSNC